jgi:CHAT domain-containing protein
MKRITQGLRSALLGRVGLALSLLLGSWGQPTAVWGQTGNASDITGVDTIELVPKSSSQLRESGATAGSLDRDALDQLLTDLTLAPANTFSLQLQALTLSYGTLLQALGIELEGEDLSPETIAILLALSYNLSGNNAHYVQVSLTQGDQVVMTRVGPDPEFQTRSPTAVQKSLAVAGLPGKDFSNSVLLSQSPPPEANDRVSRYVVPNLGGTRLQRLIQEYRSQVQNEGSLTEAIGERLYDMLIRPMEADLQAEGVETIVFALDSDLLGLPLQALKDGETFLVEKYAVAVIPSFGLTDIGFTDIRQRSMLAVGSSTFADQTELPAVPLELANISRSFRQRSLLNEQFTVENFVNTFQEMAGQGEQPGIIHLATHGEFAPGNYRNSYIQFQDQRVSLLAFRQLAVQLGWDLAASAPEMLVLSACRTAIGDPAAELGFAGLAIASGAKTALASLWYVSDLGTLALMNEFYDALAINPFKAQALQQAQLKLLSGATQVRSGQLILSSGRRIELPPVLAKLPDQDFSDPYYWSAFTLVGNWN